MKIACIGIRDEASLACVESAAAAQGLLLRPVEIESVSAVDGGDHDWEILVIGSEICAEETPGLIVRLSEEYPRGLCVVVPGEDSGEFRDRCFEAGAFEVLPPSPAFEELHQALHRAERFFTRQEKQISSEKIALITQLAAGVNHEINNPLTGLMGTAELILLENKDLPEKAQRDVNTILTLARRIQAITLRLKHLDHLRTVSYEGKDVMLDLVGEGEEAVEAEAGAEVFAHTPRLLIVDDNRLIIDIMERFLSERFEVDHAGRSSEALTRIQAKEYDLILIDLVMPEMDGLELMRIIRRMKPRQRVMMTTAYHSDERITRALSEGAIGWIKKPFNFEQIESRLWQALQAEQKGTSTNSL